jgi:bifunctional non-homologous end joining protein LigD
MATDKLAAYRAKRDFRVTPEPGPKAGRNEGEARLFVVQKHHASHLHYDFRLELDGRLLSWAVPKGPSLDPSVKRLAMHVEDHPVSYADFEGTIPPGQYGAGTVIVWDRGTWTPEGDPRRDYHAGRLKFRLDGQKLRGGFALVRTRRGEDERDAWLLIKEHDDEARPSSEGEVTELLPDSVIRHPLTAKRDAPNPPLQGARKGALPAMMSPQLATLVDEVPGEREGWSYEIKLDGYRLLARLDRGEVRLVTRGGKDWSSKLQPLCEELRHVGFDKAWIDGEIVVFDAQERPSFQALQNAFERGDMKRSAKAITFIAFDLPYADGMDLRALPLRERRALLRERMQPHLSERLRFSEALPGTPEQLLQAACRLGLEGLIAKRVDAPYEERRTRSWLKLKCQQRQEFVICGFTEPKGSRTGLGALLLAVYDDKHQLRYAGRVGTGFDAAGLKSLRAKLDPLERDSSALAGDPRARPAGNETVHWVKPELVAEVAYAERTADGSVRHATFQGLRVDKAAREIGLEEAQPPPRANHPASHPASQPGGQRSSHHKEDSTVHSLRITHPERVIDGASGITKLELARYYDTVAEHMLPHLKARPVALLRAPEGVGGQMFFQKHLQNIVIPEIRRLGPEIDPPHPSLMVIDNATALVGAAQMGVIELHTWNAVYTHIEKPDRIVFDLDPDPTLPWARMVEAAGLMKTLLDELKLKSFLKTTGGRGLHVVVPLQRRHDWDEVKRFAQAVTLHLARTLPKRFVSKMGAQNRVGKIFVDYLRNSRGATSVCAFSARARPQMGVSVPLAWEELAELRSSDQWTVRTLPQRLAERQGRDPWGEYEASRQTLAEASRKLQQDLPVEEDDGRPRRPAASRGRAAHRRQSTASGK